MIVFILTDMEGLSGVDRWDQCYHPDDNSPVYRDGREHLTADTNAAIAGAFDAGATEVRVLDGHGRNGNKGFLPEKFDPRAKRTWIAGRNPLRWEGIDETLAAGCMVGQHAMAGTINGYLDHTQNPKVITRFMINGVEHGEMSQFAAYLGGYGVPMAYTSGDEALCEETRRLFPHAGTTPTKRGTGWITCELYDPAKVRENIRRDIAASLKRVNKSMAWKLPGVAPIQIDAEFAWSEHADYLAKFPRVVRTHARAVRWWIDDAKDVYQFPNQAWTPPVEPR
jgi:D-amino peptidase